MIIQYRENPFFQVAWIDDCRFPWAIWPHPLLLTPLHIRSKMMSRDSSEIAYLMLVKYLQREHLCDSATCMVSTNTHTHTHTHTRKHTHKYRRPPDSLALAAASSKSLPPLLPPLLLCLLLTYSVPKVLAAEGYVGQHVSSACVTRKSQEADFLRTRTAWPRHIACLYLAGLFP